MINGQNKSGGIKEYIGTIISGTMLIIALSGVLLVVGEQKNALANVIAVSQSNRATLEEKIKTDAYRDQQIALLRQSFEDLKETNKEIKNSLSGWNALNSNSLHPSPFPIQKH
jgi:hypothetical protein